MPLVSLATFQLTAGSGTSDSADQAVLDAALAAVVSYLRWDPARATGTVYLDGTGTPEVVLPGRPVGLAVSEVRLDGQGGYGQVPDSFGSGTVLTQGVDYLLDAARGILRLWRVPASAGWPFVGRGQPWGGLSTYGARPAAWPRVPGCVMVTRANGYTEGACPADLQSAVCQLAAWLREVTPAGGLVATSQNYIDAGQGLAQVASEQLGAASLPALGSVRQLLAPYREAVIPGGVR